MIAVAGTCAAFSTSFSMFCVFRFVCGMGLCGLVLNSFSLSKSEGEPHLGFCMPGTHLFSQLTALGQRDTRPMVLFASPP